MRIVNFAAEGTTWTAAVETFDAGTAAHYEEVGKENWTLTCESADGSTVYETRQVFVDRGERVSLDLACGGSQPTAGKKPTGAKKRATAAKIKKAKKARATCIKKAKKLERAKKRKAAKRACKRTYKRKVRRIRARAS